MHVAAAGGLTYDLAPALRTLRATFTRKSLGLRRHRENRPHPSAGRHAADLGPEMSGWVAQLEHADQAIAPP